LVERRHEFAVRSALGASRFDRVRQLMLESAMASAVACGVGLLLANLGIVALRWLGGDSFGLAAVTMNRRVLAAGLITALLAPFLFALLPALRSSPDPNELKESRGGTAPGSRRARALIVALQAGAAVILMTQIGMLVRTTWTLSDIAPGFDPAHVLTFRVGLSGPQYDKPEAIARFTTAMLARLRGLPGVAFAGITDRLPVADGEVMARLSVEGRGPVPLEAQPAIARAAIEGDYLAAMRIPITWGRVFSAAELSGASPVALVNEEALRRFWPGADLSSGPPRRLALNAAPGGERWLDVVGVVGNLRNSDVDQGPLPEVFIPAAQQPSREMAVVVKTGGPSPLDLVPAIRAEVARLDPDQPVHDVALMTQVLYDDLAGTYVLAALLSAVGLVALGLSAAGVYGLVSYSVAQRGREIGVRMALGARPAVVVRMIVASAARPVAMGGVAGLMAATALALGADVSVPGTEARDPLNYLTVATAIVTVGLLASYLPARRAARIEPVTVLRQ
jgi:putative ABC transport system permease protein